MHKRGRVELVVLLAISVVGVISVLYLIKGVPSVGMYAPSSGSGFDTSHIYVPRTVNLPGNQYVDLPYSTRLSPYQYVYAPSVTHAGEARMSMNKCQSFCFGRPNPNLPENLYPKKRRGGAELRACVAECREQRYGYTDDTVHDYHYDIADKERHLRFELDPSLRRQN